ncbi:MAG: hypothetical protein N2171_07405 [Clostridia bacterium]|nr:hypothetical protein [Clostridia bacterium]
MLYLKIDNKNIPIEKEQVDKYHLKAGDITPNTGFNIIDEKGQKNRQTRNIKLSDKYSIDKTMSDGTIFTQAETLDLAHGTDSEI